MLLYFLIKKRKRKKETNQATLRYLHSAGEQTERERHRAGKTNRKSLDFISAAIKESQPNGDQGGEEGGVRGRFNWMATRNFNFSSESNSTLRKPTLPIRRADRRRASVPPSAAGLGVTERDAPPPHLRPPAPQTRSSSRCTHHHFPRLYKTRVSRGNGARPPVREKKNCCAVST